jgi:queuosine precursor transporter
MNELLLLATAVASTSFIIISWKLGKERLYSAIIIFLILIATVGGKIVEFFGAQTNTGNIFYAAVFLATYFLIDRHGKKEGLRSIWIGVIGVTFFILLAKLTVALQGLETSADLNRAYEIIFDPATRVTLASLVAYTLSQNLNVRLYIHLKEKSQKLNLWMRANVTNAIAQVLDSLVFFLIAFVGVVPLSNIFEVIGMSLVIKIVFMMLASPLLYFNTIESEESRGYSAVTLN